MTDDKASIFERVSITIRRNFTIVVSYGIGLVVVVLFSVVAIQLDTTVTTSIAGATSIAYLMFVVLKVADLLGLRTTAYGLASNFSHAADKAFIERDLEQMLETYDLGRPLPDNVEFNWVQEPSRSDFIQRDTVVVPLKESNNQAENAAVCAVEYTRRTVIPHIRGALHDYIDKSIDYFVSEDILRSPDPSKVEFNQSRAVGMLYEEVKSEYDESDEKKIDTYQNKVENIREAGFFGPVLLEEFSKLSEHGVYTNEIRDETIEFVDVVDEISNRSPTRSGPLAFDGDYINAALGIIGRSGDEEYYMSKAMASFSRFDTTYIIAEGEKIQTARSINEVLMELRGVRDSESGLYELPEYSDYEIGYYAWYEVPVGSVTRD